MKSLAVKSFMQVVVLLCIMMLTVSRAWAPPVPINVNQDTVVLSDEAPGNLVARFVSAGYGDFNLYDTLVTIQASTDPSVSGIIPDQFLAALGSRPAGSQIFTTWLKNIPAGSSLAISTDGTVQTVNIHAYDYYNKPGTSTLASSISGIGEGYFIHSNDPQVPLTSLIVNGPLANMTTTYNVFAIAAGSVTSAAVYNLIADAGNPKSAIDVGSVTVSNDGKYLTVTYAIDTGKWKFIETNLDVETSLARIPQVPRMGCPLPDLFAYSDPPKRLSTSKTYKIPLSDIFRRTPKPGSYDLYIAAYAEIGYTDVKGGHLKSAWGEDINFPSCRNGSMYIVYTLVIPGSTPY